MNTYVTYYQKRKLPKTITTLNDLDNFMAKNAERSVIKATKTVKTHTPPQPNSQLVYGLDALKKLLVRLNKTYPEEVKLNNFEIFEIPKATGGFRTIKAPNTLLKSLYTDIAKAIQYNLKVLHHDAAYAYVEERTTVGAIKQHQKNESMWFLKIDLRKFFDNCTPEMIERQLNTIYPFNTSPELCHELAQFATFQGALPQGTPLSPSLTNYIMIPFDHAFSEWCNSKGFIYTRYADDLLISHKEPFRFSTITEKINNILERLDYGLSINAEKTRYGNRNGRNWNLGLMLNKDNNITLGHEFKHQMKIILHKLATYEIDKGDEHIIGLISYLKQIEPTYYQHLNNYAIRKYRRSIKSLAA